MHRGGNSLLSPPGGPSRAGLRHTGEKGWGWVGEAFIAALPVLGIN